jgi:hypothetical protein
VSGGEPLALLDERFTHERIAEITDNDPET